MARFSEGTRSYRIEDVLDGVSNTDAATVGQIAALARDGVNLTVTRNGSQYTFAWVDSSDMAQSVTLDIASTGTPAIIDDGGTLDFADGVTATAVRELLQISDGESPAIVNEGGGEITLNTDVTPEGVKELLEITPSVSFLSQLRDVHLGPDFDMALEDSGFLDLFQNNTVSDGSVVNWYWYERDGGGSVTFQNITEEERTNLLTALPTGRHYQLTFGTGDDAVVVEFIHAGATSRTTNTAIWNFTVDSDQTVLQGLSSQGAVEMNIGRWSITDAAAASISNFHTEAPAADNGDVLVFNSTSNQWEAAPGITDTESGNAITQVDSTNSGFSSQFVDGTLSLFDNRYDLHVGRVVSFELNTGPVDNLVTRELTGNIQTGLHVVTQDNFSFDNFGNIDITFPDAATAADFEVNDYIIIKSSGEASNVVSQVLEVSGSVVSCQADYYITDVSEQLLTPTVPVVASDDFRNADAFQVAELSDISGGVTFNPLGLVVDAVAQGSRLRFRTADDNSPLQVTMESIVLEPSTDGADVSIQAERSGSNPFIHHDASENQWALDHSGSSDSDGSRIMINSDFGLNSSNEVSTILVNGAARNIAGGGGGSGGQSVVITAPAVPGTFSNSGLSFTSTTVLQNGTYTVSGGNAFTLIGTTAVSGRVAVSGTVVTFDVVAASATTVTISNTSDATFSAPSGTAIQTAEESLPEQEVTVTRITENDAISAIDRDTGEITFAEIGAAPAIINDNGTPELATDVTAVEVRNTIGSVNVHHEAATTAYNGGGELGGDFGHPALMNSDTITFTFQFNTEPRQAKNGLLIPFQTGLAPIGGTADDVSVITSVEINPDNDLQLIVTVEPGITAPASDDDGSNLVLWHVSEEPVAVIDGDGALYDNNNHTITIPDGRTLVDGLNIEYSLAADLFRDFNLRPGYTFPRTSNTWVIEFATGTEGNRFTHGTVFPVGTSGVAVGPVGLTGSDAIQAGVTDEAIVRSKTQLDNLAQVELVFESELTITEDPEDGNIRLYTVSEARDTLRVLEPGDGIAFSDPDENGSVTVRVEDTHTFISKINIFLGIPGPRITGDSISDSGGTTASNLVRDQYTVGDTLWYFWPHIRVRDDDASRIDGTATEHFGLFSDNTNPFAVNATTFNLIG